MYSLLLEEQSGQDYQIFFFIILDQLEDSILEVTPLKSFFLYNIFGTNIITASFLVEQLVSDEAV